MTEYPPEITQRVLGTPEQNATSMVGERPAGWTGPVVLVEYDPSWPERFAVERARIRDVLGSDVSVEHVGSTSVPGLPAKPVIDIDLTVPDSADEDSYVPALARAGYRLLLREPWWHGHRMLVTEAADVNLHVWPEGSPEAVRHRLFRDWLREHPDDRDLYAATKQRVAVETAERPEDYSLAKSDVIDAIFGRIFAA